MKNIARLSAVLLAFCLPGALWARGASGFQAGVSGSYNMGIGAVTEHIAGNAGGGVDLYYAFPLDLTAIDFGVCSSVDFCTALGKQDYVDSWYVLHATAGLFLDINLGASVKIRPQADYGLALNLVTSTTRNVSGVQPDQFVRLGASIVVEPAFMKGFAFSGGVNYQFMPEVDNTGMFLGFKAGVLFRPGSSGK